MLRPALFSEGARSRKGVGAILVFPAHNRDRLPERPLRTEHGHQN